MHRCAIEKTLKSSGLRLTQKRHRLLSLFRRRQAWSIAELHRQLSGADLSTVYRNVDFLLRKGIVENVPLRGGQSRFELARTPHHAHLVCDRCQRAECIPCPVKAKTDHYFEQRGLCSVCG